MRGGPVLTAGLVLAALATTWAWAGGPGPTLRPPTSVKFLPDDTTYDLGNTAAAPDVSLGWETTGAEHHLSCVVPNGAGLLVSQDANVDRSGVIALNATYLGVCSNDAIAPTECVVSSHDGADARIQALSGRLRLGFGGANIVDIDDDSGAFSWSFQGTAATQSELWAANAGSAMWVWVVDAGLAQNVLALHSNAGMSLNLTTYANKDRDHGYDAAVPSDPVFRVQSGDNAATTGANESVRFQYVAADDAGYAGTEKGPLRLNPADNGFRIPRNVDSDPSNGDPVCDANSEGSILYLRDTDAGAGEFCGCSYSGAAFDWYRLDAATAATGAPLLCALD